MCGVLAVIGKRGPLDLHHCSGALEGLRLRGPDFSFEELVLDGRLYLGQTVLSIVGESAPVVDTYHRSRNGQYNIVYNGEIYNYRKLQREILDAKGYHCPSDTDTEMLVNLHEIAGPAAAYDQLEGMFAYITHDAPRNKLYVGRDLVGEKVLYRYEDEQYVIISSEIGPILKIAPYIRINRSVLKEYFFTRHLLTPDVSVFEGIEAVPPGTLYEYDLTDFSSRNIRSSDLGGFVDPDVLEFNRRRDIEDLFDELESVMTTAAEKIAPSGVDFCAVFSGGVDSSLGSRFVSEVRQPKELISLVFPGKDNISSQLAPFEAVMGRDILTVDVSVDSFHKTLDSVYKSVCAPLPTHSFVSQAILSQVVRETGAKVVIGGDGGDELFGGYEFYKRLLSRSYPSTNPSIYSGYVDLGFEFEGWEPVSLISQIKQRWLKHSEVYEFEPNERDRIIQTVLYSDTVIQLESTGIRAGDTMSMLHSIEPRSLFLMWDVMRFALNLPAKLKVDSHGVDELMTTRPALKHLFVRKFGRELLFPKQGFSGFPNEAGRIEVNDGRYPLVMEVLGLQRVPEYSSDESARAAEWKLLNTEIFLRKFRDHA